MNIDSFLSRAGGRLQQSAIRRMGTVAAEKNNLISFAPGYPSPEAFVWEEYRSIAAELLCGDDGAVLQYGPTRGYAPLIQTVVGLLAARSIAADIAQVMMTTGSQQGLDLLGRVLLDPGDVVLVELPSYTGAIAAFRNAQASLEGVRLDPDGVDLDDLERVTRRVRAEGRRLKFLYIIPNFQNPTGALATRTRRLALLEWAERHDVLIVEDDPYGELRFDDGRGPESTRPIKADDRTGRVVYLSSFSKTLAPAFRVAFLAAHEQLAARFEIAKQTMDLCTGNLDQRFVYEVCRRGVLAREVPRLRQLYRRKRDLMDHALRDRLGATVSWTSPGGGFFLWLTLPPDIDAGQLLPHAVGHDVIYVPGQAFFVDGSGANTMRLAFSYVPDALIPIGVGRLADAFISARPAAPAPRVTPA